MRMLKLNPNKKYNKKQIHNVKVIYDQVLIIAMGYV